MSRNTSKNRTGFTHITNAKMQTKGGAKDAQTQLQTYSVTFWGDGETFDEENNKEQRLEQASTHITNAREGRRERQM